LLWLVRSQGPGAPRPAHHSKFQHQLNRRGRRAGKGRHGGGGGREAHTGAGKPGGHHGARRRGSAAGGVSGGGRRAARLARGARHAHSVPLRGAGRLLSACRVRRRAAQPRPRRRRGGRPLGRRHIPRRHLWHLRTGPFTHWFPILFVVLP
jgi:hypothetical protein